MRLCIIQPSLNAVSETFLRAHAERLPGEITVIHDLDRPSIDGCPVLSQSAGQRALRRIGRLVSGRSWEWEATAAFIKAIRRSRAQAVLAEYGPTGVAVMEACVQTGVPLIVHFHGYDASMHEVLRQNHDNYLRLWQVASGIVVVSHAMHRKLVSLGAPEDKLIYNPYGVDCDRFGEGSPGEAPATFVAVGRFVEKKCPHLTLLAFKDVLGRFSDARLRMIGDGPLLPVCRDLANGLGIGHAVTFLGAQPHDMVQREMRQARAFVQHSAEAANGDSEGTPVGILEAGATGLPVVATRHAGIPDVVVEGETGLLVDERDISGMANHMLDLATNPQKAAEIGAAARRHVAGHYSIGRSIAKLSDVIGQCIQGRPLISGASDLGLIPPDLHLLRNVDTSPSRTS